MEGSILQSGHSGTLLRAYQELMQEALDQGPIGTDGLYLGKPLPGYSGHRVAISPTGEPTLIFRTGQDAQGGGGFRTEALRVAHGARCEIRGTGGAGTEAVVGSVVECLSQNPQVQRLFLEIFEEALESLGAEPSIEDLDAWISHASSLFSRLRRPGRSQIIGLWGELVAMLAIGDVQSLAGWWHEDPQEAVDFLGPSGALEIKTCRDAQRIHRFSMDQLHEHPGNPVYVGSVIARGNPDGLTCLDLLERVTAQLDSGGLRDQVREVALEIGGEALEDEDLRFDLDFSLQSLRLWRSGQIPQVEGPIPPEVLKVSLRVRCDGIQEDIDPQEVLAQMG